MSQFPNIAVIVQHGALRGHKIQQHVNALLVANHLFHRQSTVFIAVLHINFLAGLLRQLAAFRIEEAQKVFIQGKFGHRQGAHRQQHHRRQAKNPQFAARHATAPASGRALAAWPILSVLHMLHCLVQNSLLLNCGNLLRFQQISIKIVWHNISLHQMLNSNFLL